MRLPPNIGLASLKVNGQCVIGDVGSGSVGTGHVGWVRHAFYAATHQLGPRSAPPSQAVLQVPTRWWVMPQTARLTHPTFYPKRERACAFLGVVLFNPREESI